MLTGNDTESEEELKFEEPVVYEKLPRHLPPASQRNRVNREEKRRARMRVRPGRSFEEPRHAGYEDDEEEEDVEEENYHPAREPQDRSRLYEEEVEERGFLPTRPLVRTPVVRGEQRSRDFVIPQNEQEYFEEERDIRYSPSRQKMDSRRYSTKPVYAPMQHEQDDGDVYYEQMPSRSRPQSSRKPREEPLYQRDQQDYPEYASPKGARRKSYYPPVEREEVEEYENRHPLPVQRRNSVAPGYSQEDYEELVSQPAQYHSKAVASPRYPDEEQVPPRSRAMTPVKARKSSTEDTYRRVIVQSAVKRSAPPSASRALANVDRSLYRVEDSHTQSPGLRSPIKKVTVPSPAQPVEYQDTYEPADYDDNVGYDDQALPSHHEEPSPVPQRKSVSKVAKVKL